MTPYTLYDFLSFIIPGAGILAAAVFGWSGQPRTEPGASAMVGILAASFVVGHLNAAIAVFLQPVWWGHRPGTDVPSTEGLFVARGPYGPEDERAFMAALRERFSSKHSDRALFELAYSALQRDGKDDRLQTLNQQIGFYRNAVSACLIAAAIVVLAAATGRSYLPVALWLPTLGVSVVLLVMRYRRFWVWFGGYVLRGAVVQGSAAGR